MIDINITPAAPYDDPLLVVLADAFPVLLGAFIGFGVSWLFAWRAERDHRLALAYELFFEVQGATENISEIRRVLTINLAKVGSQFEYNWQAVQIPTGFDWNTRAKLNPAGLALLARAKKFELINELMELVRLHDLLLIITAEYARRQEVLTEKLRAEGETQVIGTTISLAIPKEATAKHAPDIMRVEDLLGQLLERAMEGGDFAQSVTQRLGSELRESLGNDKRFRGRIEYRAKSEKGAVSAASG